MLLAVQAGAQEPRRLFEGDHPIQPDFWGLHATG